MFVDNFKKKDNNNVLISKQTSSVILNKWSFKKNLSIIIIKQSIHLKHLNTYTEKFIQKHLNFIHNTETVFCLMSENFFNDEMKILYIMQFLMKESQNA